MAYEPALLAFESTVANASVVEPLPHADAQHVRAAQGWLDLNNSLEAADELAKIAPESRLHPDALEVQWKVLAAGTKWEASLCVADAITKVAPERASGWIMKSLSLRGLDRIQEAFDVLFPIVGDFRHVPAIAYDLACYACRLGRVDEAWSWLEKACKADGTGRFEEMALSDLDLKPLWPKLEKH
jgi:hypothetical protein